MDEAEVEAVRNLAELITIFQDDFISNSLKWNRDNERLNFNLKRSYLKVIIYFLSLLIFFYYWVFTFPFTGVFIIIFLYLGKKMIDSIVSTLPFDHKLIEIKTSFSWDDEIKQKLIGHFSKSYILKSENLDEFRVLEISNQSDVIEGAELFFSLNNQKIELNLKRRNSTINTNAIETINLWFDFSKFIGLQEMCKLSNSLSPIKRKGLINLAKYPDEFLAYYFNIKTVLLEKELVEMIKIPISFEDDKLTIKIGSPSKRSFNWEKLLFFFFFFLIFGAIITFPYLINLNWIRLYLISNYNIQLNRMDNLISLTLITLLILSFLLTWIMYIRKTRLIGFPNKIGDSKYPIIILINGIEGAYLYNYVVFLIKVFVSRYFDPEALKFTKVLDKSGSIVIHSSENFISRSISDSYYFDSYGIENLIMSFELLDVSELNEIRIYGNDEVIAELYQSLHKILNSELMVYNQISGVLQNFAEENTKVPLNFDIESLFNKNFLSENIDVVKLLLLFGFSSISFSIQYFVLTQFSNLNIDNLFPFLVIVAIFLFLVEFYTYLFLFSSYPSELGFSYFNFSKLAERIENLDLKLKLCDLESLKSNITLSEDQTNFVKLGLQSISAICIFLITNRVVQNSTYSSGVKAIIFSLTFSAIILVLFYTQIRYSNDYGKDQTSKLMKGISLPLLKVSFLPLLVYLLMP